MDDLEIGRESGMLDTDDVEIRTLTPEDLDWVVRIDAEHSGTPRTEYFRVKLAEAERDTGLRISLAAWLDGEPAGVLLARLYYGEFGVPEAVATLDTLGVAKRFAGRHARVHGYVALGSIERDVEAKRVSFRVQNDPPHAGGAPGQTLEVVYASLETPDLFKDGAEVVVEGHLAMVQGSPVFQADNVMAKCPSKFEAQAGPAAESPIEL